MGGYIGMDSPGLVFRRHSAWLILSLLRSAYDPDNSIFTLGESIDGSQFILFTHLVDSCMTKFLESPRNSSDTA